MGVGRRTGFPLKRVCDAQARAHLKRALRLFACDVFSWHGITTYVCAIPGSKFREHSSLPNHAARVFAEDRHAATSRRTCS